MDIPNIEELLRQINELKQKIEYLENVVRQQNEYIFQNEAVFWTILFGIVATIGVALFFVCKNVVQAGVEKGLNNQLNKLSDKANKKCPEFNGHVGLKANENDKMTARFVKLLDKPIINIETDEGNAQLLINHSLIPTYSIVNKTLTTFNGFQGEVNMKAINIAETCIINLHCKVSGGLPTQYNIITCLPEEYYPHIQQQIRAFSSTAKIQSYEIVISVRTDGSVCFDSAYGVWAKDEIEFDITYIK